MRLSLYRYIHVAGLIALWALAACQSEAGVITAIPTEEDISTVTPFQQVAQQPTLAPTETLPETARLVVWWPDVLAPTDNVPAAERLAAYVAQFEAENADSATQVEYRLKKIQDVGGIMSALRTANAVAPGVLPDLTLLRREDLLSAVQAGLIQPMEGLLTTSTLSELTDLSRTVLELGQVEGQLYGIPFMLEVAHLVYRSQPEDEPIVNWRFEDVLTRRMSLVFPASRANPINPTYYVQYLSAGGTPPLDGEILLNADALRAVLRFYEQAHDTGIISADVINYTTAQDYQLQLLNGTVDAAVLNSTLFLSLQAQGEPLRAAPLPTQTGQLATMLNGWMWVMTTNNADRQALALEFLNWMMVPARQAEFAELIYMLPSQRSALRIWDGGGLDAEVVTGILANSALPLSPNEGGIASRAMQNALIAVLSGESSAEEAVEDVLDQVNG